MFVLFFLPIATKNFSAVPSKLWSPSKDFINSISMLSGAIFWKKKKQTWMKKETWMNDKQKGMRNKHEWTRNRNEQMKNKKEWMNENTNL